MYIQVRQRLFVVQRRSPEFQSARDHTMTAWLLLNVTQVFCHCVNVLTYNRFINVLVVGGFSCFLGGTFTAVTKLAIYSTPCSENNFLYFPAELIKSWPVLLFFFNFSDFVYTSTFSTLRHRQCKQSLWSEGQTGVKHLKHSLHCPYNCTTKWKI